jgi:flagellar basal-body rod protein FlgC
MSILKAMDVLSSGLHAQRTRMDVTTANLANAETTRTPEGGAYKPQHVVFESVPSAGGQRFESALEGVRVAEVADMDKPPRQVYDPGHPDADPATGIVEMPDINVVEQMVDLITASRSFEANVTAFEQLKQSVRKAIELGR